MKPVIVYFMHEDEQSLANQHLEFPENTESYVLGEASITGIDTMRKSGLIVQELDEHLEQHGLQKIQWKFDSYKNRGLDIPASDDSYSSGADMDEANAMSDASDDSQLDLIGKNYFILELAGPLMESWKKNIESIGVEILEAINHFTYKAKLNLTAFSKLKELHYVKNLTLWGSQETSVISKSSLGSTSEVIGFDTKMLRFDVIMHESKSLPIVLNWLASKNVPIEGCSRNKVRIFLKQNSHYISSLRALKEVSSIEEYMEPKLFNDIARVLMTLDGNQNSFGLSINFEGDGEIVAIADTGIDDNHKDFGNRILHKLALGRAGDYSDFHGHGTHVAGSVLGNGCESSGQYKGAAPKANLIFQSLMDHNGKLSGLPIHLGDLFDQAYQLGARIHNNSWGSATNSRYTINSVEVDDFVNEKRDMLILFAAGNEGSAKGNINADVGFVDWLSIGSPASSKNSLTVGASRSNRTSGGISNLTYGSAWPNNFPDIPIADETISGKDTSIAGYSSRGPCDDGRIKPDVVAPGTDIISTKSSIASINNFDGSVINSQKYAFMGGTSMACPLVTGCAAIVREYYKKERQYSTPSASLIKATLINGTKALLSQDAMSPYNIIPNFQQGFGRIDMMNTLPSSCISDLKLSYIDVWNNSSLWLNVTGERRRYVIEIGEKLPLRICLVYTDIPGRALQNNLNLMVEYDDNGNRIKRIGNEEFTKSPGNFSIPDGKNNVEIVRIDNPKAGNFLIQVSAFNLLKAGQDFSLVVTGDLKSDLTGI